MVAMKKQFKLAACFFLLTVLLRGVSVDACSAEDQTCDPNNPDCCQDLECLEVSTGVFKCEPEACEDHEGHSCSLVEPVRECCEPLECQEVSAGVFQCEPEGCEDHEGHACSFEEPVRECCSPLECVQVSLGVFQCEDTSSP